MTLPGGATPVETATNSELLASLMTENDRGRAAWAELDARLRPILFGFARRLGLSQEDAADVAQETLLQFLRELRRGTYDRERGRLRAFILGISRNRVIDLQRRRNKAAGQRGESAFEGVAGDDELAMIWQSECRAHVLARAMVALRNGSRLSETTLRAFELYAREGKAPEEVAQSLGVTVNTVYLAKFECLKRIREIVGEMEAREDVF